MTTIVKLEFAYLMASNPLSMIGNYIAVNSKLIEVVANDYDPYSMSISDVGGVVSER